MERRSLTILSVLLLAVMPLVATAQGMPPMPATPVPGEAPEGVLAEFTVPELPTPHAEIWFIRMQLDPGGSVAMGIQAGPSIIYVESGAVTLAADTPVTPGGAGASPVAGAGGDTVLVSGASAMVDSGTELSFRNEGNEKVTFLMLLMYSGEQEDADQGSYPEPVGLAQAGVSIGTAEFMPLPAAVRIERVVLQPGGIAEPEVSASEMDLPGYLGMELGAIETGQADVMLEYSGMSNLTWPGMLRGEMARPEMVTFTRNVELGTGDAYAFGGSTLTWTNTGDAPLTILRVVILPEMPTQ